METLASDAITGEGQSGGSKGRQCTRFGAPVLPNRLEKKSRDHNLWAE